MISFKHSGSFGKTEKFLSNRRDNLVALLHRYGQEGVRVLSEATPSDTGLTASSWNYTVKASRGSYSISWSNSNTVDGVPVVVLIQYGHATGNGGYVQGRDFINPVMQPLFDKITEEIWKEVVKI